MAVMPLKERNETSDQVVQRTRDGVESSRAAEQLRVDGTRSAGRDVPS